MGLTKVHKKLLNEILMNPQTTVRTIIIKGNPYLERRFIEGTRIIIERIRLQPQPSGV